MNNLTVHLLDLELAESSFILAMATPQGGGSPFAPLIPLVLMIGIFYFIIVLPMRRRQKKVQEFLTALKVGDQVVTSGGLHADITRVNEKTLQIEIAERVRVDIARSAIVGYQGQEPVAPASGS
jgi:preprotein translocase subunit YajC